MLTVIKDVFNRVLGLTTREEAPSSATTPWYMRAEISNRDSFNVTSAKKDDTSLTTASIQESPYKPDDIVIPYIPLGYYPTTVGDYKTGNDKDSTGGIAHIYLPTDCPPFYLFDKLIQPRPDSTLFDSRDDYERPQRIIENGKEEWAYTGLTRFQIEFTQGVSHRGWGNTVLVYHSGREWNGPYSSANFIVEAPRTLHSRCAFTDKISGKLIGEPNQKSDKIPSFLVLNADPNNGLTIKNIYTGEVLTIKNSNPNRKAEPLLVSPASPS